MAKSISEGLKEYWASAQAAGRRAKAEVKSGVKAAMASKTVVDARSTAGQVGRDMGGKMRKASDTVKSTAAPAVASITGAARKAMSTKTAVDAKSIMEQAGRDIGGKMRKASDTAKDMGSKANDMANKAKKTVKSKVNSTRMKLTGNVKTGADIRSRK